MASKQRLRVGVLGASGFTGGELLRVLLSHPNVEVVHAGAYSRAGTPVATIHPFLLGTTSLMCDATSPNKLAGAALDVVFLALPHGESTSIVSSLPPGVKVIDLASDHRLNQASGFVYGLTEWTRPALREAQRVANPGCFATAVALALAPLVKAGLITGRVLVSAVTGSSGSGATLTSGTHHPLRADGFSAYKVFAHQHTAEINQMLRGLGHEWNGAVVLQTHSGPFVRGIHATLFAGLTAGVDGPAVSQAFAAAYGQEALIRLRPTPVDVKWVRGTPFTDLHWAVEGDQLIIFAALDNMLKGAASQAVQNMNVICGLPETTGLTSFLGGGL